MMAWYEVWADEGLDPPYVLLVRATHDGVIHILDPNNGNKSIFKAQHYEQAREFLSEDEYEPVCGRMLIEP